MLTRNLKRYHAVVEHEGVRLVGRFLAKPFIQVHMKLPFDGISVPDVGKQPTLEKRDEFVAEILVGIYRTCLWARANQEELRARFRPVVEAGEGCGDYMSHDRYFEVLGRLEDDPRLSDEEREQLMEPLNARTKAWNDLRVATLRRALADLGHCWSHAFNVLSDLAPHFDPTRVAERRRSLRG